MTRGVTTDQVSPTLTPNPLSSGYFYCARWGLVCLGTGHLLDSSPVQETSGQASSTIPRPRSCSQRLPSFLHRYLPLFLRSEQRTNATIVLRAELSGLELETSEPIANDAGVRRRPIQDFVGRGAWDDDASMAELRHEWGDRHAVLIIDPRAGGKDTADGVAAAAGVHAVDAAAGGERGAASRGDQPHAAA